MSTLKKRGGGGYMQPYSSRDGEYIDEGTKSVPEKKGYDSRKVNIPKPKTTPKSDGERWSEQPNRRGVTSASGVRGSVLPLDKRLDKQSMDWYYHTLTDEERSAVYAYTIHNYTKNPELAERSQVLEQALGKFETKEDSEKEISSLYFSYGEPTEFKSTSVDRAKAEHYAQNQGGWIIEYHIKKGRHGAYINDQVNQGEKEFLINRGQKQRLVGSDPKKKVVYIEIG